MFVQNVADHVSLEAMVLSNEAGYMAVESPVNGVSGNYQIPEGDFHLKLPNELVMKTSGIVMGKGVLITTNSSVSVYGLNHDECCASDGYFTISVKNLGTSYIIGRLRV